MRIDINREEGFVLDFTEEEFIGVIVFVGMILMFVIAMVKA